MATSFQDFLRQKTEGTDWRARTRNREEWLWALNGLLDQVCEELRGADREGYLELIRYEVERVEEHLGVYDAPALKVRLGPDSVDFLPVGRYAAGPLGYIQIRTILDNWGDHFGGRVDITNGEKRYILLRRIDDGADRWYATTGNSVEPKPFDQDCLESILQDLLK